MKKNKVGHSIPARVSVSDWRVTSSAAVAPASATVAGSRPSALWRKKRRMVSSSTGKVRISSSRSSIERLASRSITRSRASEAI
jgi:hypothetical protein